MLLDFVDRVPVRFMFKNCVGLLGVLMWISVPCQAVIDPLGIIGCAWMLF